VSTDVPESVPPPPAAGRQPPPADDRKRRVRRWPPGTGWLLTARAVLSLAVAITLMSAALAVAMRLDDRQIDGHLATSTATVLSVSPLRTGIEFVDGAGVTVRPPDGVLYPGLLSVGQRFQIEYSSLDPTVVRVAGRTAAVGDLVLALTLVLTWIIALSIAFVCRRRFRKRPAANAATSATAVSGP
jgi:hypothetical protein